MKTSAKSFSLIPSFSLKGRCFYINNTVIELRGMPMTVRLIRAFLSSKQSYLKRNDLLSYVYEEFRPEEKTPRFNGFLKQNLTKLISRARIKLENHFNEPDNPWIEFFIYNGDDDSWSFFRLRNEYIAKKEQDYKKSNFLPA